MRFQSKFQEFASAASPHAWQTQQHLSWRVLQPGLPRRTDSTNGNKSRSLKSYDRWLSITLQYRSAIHPSTQQEHQPRRGVLIHSFFLKTSCSTRSSFPSFATKMKFVLCRFAVVVIVIFCAIKLQITIINPTSGSSSSRPGSRLSCLPAIPRALMHASHQVRCWACPDATWCSTSSLVGPRPQQHWVAELQIPSSSMPASTISHSISMICSLVCWRLHKRAALSLACNASKL